MSINWPPTLVREIAERRAVLFIGAGVSRAAAPQLPGWDKLILDLSTKLELKKDRVLVSKLVREGKLLDAAELITALMLPAERRASLEKIFLLTPPPSSDIYRHLLDLDLKVCVTTNYDQLIEKNFEAMSGGNVAYHVRSYKYENFVADLRSPSRVILKIHGCITESSKLILDRRSYFEAKASNRGIYDIMVSLSTVNTILFLGYSMNDPDIQLVLETVHASARSDHTHYALVSKFAHPSLRKSLSDTYNVTFVEHAKGDYAQLPLAVEALRDAVKAERAGLGIP